MEKIVFVGVFRILYWFVVEEFLYIIKYLFLLGYVKFMGCLYLNFLYKGENVNYES